MKAINSPTKIIFLGKHTLFLAMVAPDASNLRISEGFPDPPKGDLAYDTDLNVWKTGDAILPDGPWAILGFSDHLPDEHLKELLPNTFQPRRQSEFNDIMEANKVYHRNPYREKPLRLNNHDDYIKYTSWQEAEANTGNWIALKLEK